MTKEQFLASEIEWQMLWAKRTLPMQTPHGECYACAYAKKILCHCN